MAASVGLMLIFRIKRSTARSSDRISVSQVHVTLHLGSALFAHARPRPPELRNFPAARRFASGGHAIAAGGQNGRMGAKTPPRNSRRRALDTCQRKARSRTVINRKLPCAAVVRRSVPLPAYMIFIREEPVRDEVAMSEYRRMNRESARNFELTPLVVYGAVEAVEGTAPDGIVLLKFPDVAHAKAWYNSPAYQAALQHRLGAAEYRALIVEGL
jgi:uncharacterized protein (DUF1330 family)